MSIFSQRLKQAMDERGVTVSSLSLKTGLGKSSISQYLSDGNKPRPKTLSLIAQSLNVSALWLSGETEETTEEGTVNNVSIELAANLMGVSKQFVRVGLQQGSLPFGYAVKLSANRFTYYISPTKFTEFTGVKL